MNRQDLFKQAHYTFQRGNRELAQKLLAELLARYPNDESAWMLLGRVVTQKERRIECYERVIELNPKNTEAKQELVRVQFPGYTYKDQRGIVPEGSGQISNRFKIFMQTSFALMAVLLVFASTTFVIAKANPGSPIAKLWSVPTPAPQNKVTAIDVAKDARDEVAKKYPGYAPLVDALIELAVSNTENGMEGAPARPGRQIFPSEDQANQARAILENAAAQSGSSVSVTLTEGQVTSLIAKGMRENPDVPIHDVQVYFMNGKIQAWGIVQGQSISTAALAIGTVLLDANGFPSVSIESMQVGQTQVSAMLISQAEAWVNQMLVEAINKQAPGLRITQVAIGSGVVTMSATR